MSTKHSHSASSGPAVEFSKALDSLSKREADALNAVREADEESKRAISNARERALKILDKAAQEAQQEREAILADASYDIQRQVDAILDAGKSQSKAIANSTKPGLGVTLARQILKDA